MGPFAIVQGVEDFFCIVTNQVAAARGYRASRLHACYCFFVCIICVEFEKGRMTAKEARRALGEMVPNVGAEHGEQVERALREAEAKATTPGGASSGQPVCAQSAEGATDKTTSARSRYDRDRRPCRVLDERWNAPRL
jgi:hypothetical protein